VESGDEVFLDGAPSARRDATAAWVLASTVRGDRAEALAALRALDGWIEATDGSPSRAVTAAAVVRLTMLPSGAVPTIPVTVDGVAHTVTLTDGVAELPARALSTAGTHAVTVSLPQGAILRLDASARFTRPWTATRSATSPFNVVLDGPLGARDTHAGLVLRIQNRAPRLIASPFVRIDLPSGAEIDAASRARIDRRLAHPMVVAQRTLTLPLRGLAPGATVRIPIPIRWTVSGSLRGPAVVARVSRDTDSAATVVLPRPIVIPDAGDEPPAPASER
jgi:hypothetical protein